MRKIVIANQKGGVGKSTTTINLGAGLAKKGKKVLIIDADAQGHSTIGLGISTKKTPTIAELLTEEDVTTSDVIEHTYIKGLDIIPSDLTLAVAVMKLSGLGAKEFILRSKVKDIKGYDFILIDAPPTFETMTQNAFASASEIILPVVLDYFCLEGVSSFLDTINFVNKNITSHLSHKIAISGVLINRYDLRSKHSREVLTSFKEIFGNCLFESTIPTNIKLTEAHAVGKSVYDYAPDCKGSQAYLRLTQEVIKRGKNKTTGVRKK